MMGARTPSGRTYSLPEEIAVMALYLSSTDSKPVHGAVMVMDEGFSLGVRRPPLSGFRGMRLWHRAAWSPA